jgi:sec-independent protein translocase protein TatA
MFGVGGHLPELIIILVIGLLILGPGKLPQVGAAFGKTIKEFRKGTNDELEEDAKETTTSKSSSKDREEAVASKQ